MKKRGQLLTLWMLISIIGAILVAYVFVQIGTQRGSGEAFLKSRLAKEIALEINALYSVPGDAYIVNDQLYGFSFKIKDDEVRVFRGQTEGIIGIASYPFIKSGQQQFNYEFKEPKQIVIYKTGTQIKITQEIPEIFKEAKTELSLKGKKILIDVMFHDEQSLKVIDSIKVYQHNQPIEGMDFDESMEKNPEDFDVIISIHSVAGEKAFFYINKKSYENAKSVFLAEILSSNLVGIIEQREVIEVEQLDNKERALNNNKIAVYIELPETKKISETAAAIYNSLKG